MLEKITAALRIFLYSSIFFDSITEDFEKENWRKVAPSQYLWEIRPAKPMMKMFWVVR